MSDMGDEHPYAKLAAHLRRWPQENQRVREHPCGCLTWWDADYLEHHARRCDKHSGWHEVNP